jgi:uncharacterized protein (DUF2164 family)
MAILEKGERADGVRRIQEYFREERGEEVGDLAAGILLDFVEKELGPAFYNRGVRDAKALALRFSDSLTEELEALERLTPKATRTRA